MQKLRNFRSSSLDISSRYACMFQRFPVPILIMMHWMTHLVMTQSMSPLGYHPGRQVPTCLDDSSFHDVIRAMEGCSLWNTSTEDTNGQQEMTPMDNRKRHQRTTKFPHVFHMVGGLWCVVVG